MLLVPSRLVPGLRQNGGGSRRRPNHLAAATSTDPANLVGAAWDPEGLLPPMPSGGHFARRQQQRPQQQQPTQATAAPHAAATEAGASARSTPAPAADPPCTPPSPAAMLPPPPPPTPALASGLRPILPIPPSLPQSDGEGLPASELDAPTRRALEALLQRHYMTLDLDTPGLRVLCLDPPIFTVDAFLPRDRCDDVVAAAEATGLMVASKIGAGNVAAGGGNTYNERRTSTSMLVDAGALACSPRLERLVTDIQARGRGLLQAKKWRAWGKPGKMPAPGQYTYESCQVARYERGQHFLAHEDAFPRGLAQSNGFQRAATLLLYLNDVPLGGRTRFDLLGLSVQPRKGRLLVFFPAQADGAADGRTLHTAEDAGETTKHVLQQWVACGMGALPSAAVAAVAAEQQQQQQQQGQGQPRVEASTPVASATAAGEVQRGKETGAQAGKRTTAKQGGGGTGGGGKRKGFGSTKR